jgi:hypothetical protein
VKPCSQTCICTICRRLALRVAFYYQLIASRKYNRIGQSQRNVFLLDLLEPKVQRIGQRTVGGCAIGLMWAVSLLCREVCIDVRTTSCSRIYDQKKTPIPYPETRTPSINHREPARSRHHAVVQAHNIAEQCGRQFLGIYHPQSCHPASYRVLHASTRSHGPQHACATGGSLLLLAKPNLVLLSLPPSFHNGMP